MSSQTPYQPQATTNGTHHARPGGDRRDIAAGPGSSMPPVIESDPSVSDELAALFLGEAGEPGEGTPRTQSVVENKPLLEGHRPRLTLLVLGNLPVFAGAWASQYARTRARTLGRPLGLLSLSDESARLEVFGSAGPGSMLANDLERALAHLAHLGADLIVRLPESEAGWIAGVSAIDGLAVLTGADDPAIVAAYQSLKSITQDMPRGGEEGHCPQVRVVVAGCEEPRAGESAGKLTQAAERFLGLKVGVEPAIARIDAGVSLELYHGSRPAWADVPDMLAGFVGKAHTEPVVRTAPASVIQSPPKAEPHAPAHQSQEHETEPVTVAWEAGTPIEPRPSPAVAQPAAGTGREPAGVEPSGRGRDRSRSAGSPMPRGIQRLDAVCPYAREVGIGVDAGGVPHVVAWAQDSDSASPAVRDLVVASSWLRDHAELVACLVGRPLRADTSVRHLVLADARGALGLAQGELRLHVGVAEGDADGPREILVDLN